MVCSLYLNKYELEKKSSPKKYTLTELAEEYSKGFDEGGASMLCVVKCLDCKHAWDVYCKKHDKIQSKVVGNCGVETLLVYPD